MLKTSKSSLASYTFLVNAVSTYKTSFAQSLCARDSSSPGGTETPSMSSHLRIGQLKVDVECCLSVCVFSPHSGLKRKRAIYERASLPTVAHVPES